MKLLLTILILSLLAAQNNVEQLKIDRLHARSIDKYASNKQTEQLNTTLKDHQFLGGTYNDIWGFKQNNQQYVIISKRFGFAVYKINSDGTADLIVNEDSANNEDNLWGEVRYYNGYIYKSTEADSVRIYSLNLIDSTVTYLNRFHGAAHNISLYQNYLLTCGGATGVNGGVACYDLSDPVNPTLKWVYDTFYVHDFTIQNDTLYVAEIYNSSFALYDVSNVIGSTLSESYLVLRHQYANGFTHNIWPSPDGKYVVTTDEHNTFDHLQFWDISDKNNIINLMKHREGDASVVHNAFIKNDFIYTSYYTNGFVVFDISDKRLPVKIAAFDGYESPNDVDTWGVYPFMDSNYVALSNIENGLDIVEFDQTIRAGSLTISFFDSLTIPYNQPVTITVSDNKYVKYYQEGNQIKLKGKPGSSYQLTFEIAAENFSTTFNHQFLNNATDSLDYVLHLADTLAPNKPNLQSLLAGNASLTLNWHQNLESDIARYRIYLDSISPTTILFDSVDKEITSYNFSNLVNGTSYYARIQAVDLEGNVSVFSEELSATPKQHIGSVFNTTISVFQNPVLTDHINLSFTVNLDLSSDPIVSLGSIPMIVNKIDNRHFNTSFKKGNDGDYQFRLQLESYGATIDTIRTINIQTISKSNSIYYLYDQKIELKISQSDLAKAIVLVTESDQKENTVTFLNQLNFSQAARLSIKYDSNNPESHKLFIYKHENEFTEKLSTQVFSKQNTAVTYINQLGTYKLAIDPNFSGSNLVPEHYQLSQNYPNPFNPNTTIQYDLPEDGRVQLIIFNMLGQRIRTLANEFQRAASNKTVSWDGRSDAGQKVASGIYIYQLIGKSFRLSKKMILIK